ncbi:hypothetical protein [Streptacidiphilus anmyonensis]|uniref:hypothetical protein n=1 Tax=Streptacidiphilus anmyonensis TaxID=405782 RepID=UPI0005A768BE|nr:hypothetical protein [Streptacidiphilus anmyonensis]
MRFTEGQVAKILALAIEATQRNADGSSTRDPEETLKLSIDKVKPITKVWFWLGGVVTFSLLPMFWGYLSGSGDTGFYSIFGKGDLFLLSTVLLAAGLTEIALIVKAIDNKGLLGTLILGALLLVVVDVARYSTVAQEASNPAHMEALPHSIAWASLIMYLLAALHSTTCVYLGAKTE